MEIKNAKYEISSAKVSQCPATDVPEYAFIGRSNVGKSSLINMLTNNGSLAKTSQKPGKTLLINHFKINNGQWYIVDLPGYGYAARGKDQRESFARMIKGYALGRSQMACLFILIDVRHEPQKIDLEFVDFCGENGVPIAIVFTKADKVSRAVADHNMALFRKELLQRWEELPPIFLTSSEKKHGRDEILDFIERTNAIWSESQEEVSPDDEDSEDLANPEVSQEIQDEKHEG
ncbi:MAG: ribosome biogenesis GTP-binding protein YihA/YsxC [Muribaculaceae bacterium]|nr:ribosome biogenesis GTP-binding protein YihA/YsxC [Muribaculaceae bacterium]MDE6551874.1 ribosome biogenesis GTP-binding protein YihA/YsxC [Muribaculaceae bacterium]MDE7350781.1 ribosome biogenesis GTP-binding protein YihA/YsxC [Muribaculaceae bacterium]